MRSGQIIILNGTSSSGKSTIAKALQDMMDEPYLRSGIDHFLQHYPPRMIEQSSDPDPSTAEGWLAVFHDDIFVDIRIGRHGYQFLAAMYRAIAALARSGINVIVDDVIYDSVVLQSAVQALDGCNVLFVGIRCPLAVAKQREQARGNRAIGGASVFHHRVHQHGIYDLEVDSAKQSAFECALQIKQSVQAQASFDSSNSTSAFAQLKAKLAGATGRVDQFSL